VSLADYRGRPLLLGIFRGIYCPFCRRALVTMGRAWERLRGEGVEALAIVATTPENARRYFGYRPAKLPVAADPEYLTHRLYRIPRFIRAEIAEQLGTIPINPTGELPEPLPLREASPALTRLEGYEPTPTDREDATQPFLQLVAQFLVDRDGVIRWSNVECAREGTVAGIGQFPTEDELRAATRALPR
jgi:hypothetical protein